MIFTDFPNIAEMEQELSTLRHQNECLQRRLDILTGSKVGGANRLNLTPAEYRMVHLIASRAPDLVDRDALFEARKESPVGPDDNTEIKIVDVNIARIRKKLIDYGIQIKTVWAVGRYMTEEDADAFYKLTYAQEEIAA